MCKILAIVLAMACLGLVGCAKGVWIKPGATQADFERDKAECEYEVEKHSLASMMNVNPISEGIRQGNMLKQCMLMKGWRLQQVEAEAVTEKK